MFRLGPHRHLTAAIQRRVTPTPSTSHFGANGITSELNRVNHGFVLQHPTRTRGGERLREREERGRNPCANVRTFFFQKSLTCSPSSFSHRSRSVFRGRRPHSFFFFSSPRLPLPVACAAMKAGQSATGRKPIFLLIATPSRLTAATAGLRCTLIPALTAWWLRARTSHQVIRGRQPLTAPGAIRCCHPMSSASVSSALTS